jgi:hypothetical protein
MSAEREPRFEPVAPLEARRFENISSRSTVDYALRTMQQGLVHFSAMADTKANILITVCALLFSVGLTQLHREEIHLPLLALLASAASSLILAILAVLPASSRASPPGVREPGRALFNHFFFMHFSTLSVQEYLDEMDRLVSDLPRFYETLVRDLHGQGTALARKKYRLLRWSYTALLLGVGSAALLLVGQQLAR